MTEPSKQAIISYRPHFGNLENTFIPEQVDPGIELGGFFITPVNHTHINRCGYGVVQAPNLRMLNQRGGLV